MSYWLVGLARRVGFHKPGAVGRGESSPTRASSPQSEQGGSLDLLIEGICFQGMEYFCSPNSSANVVGLSGNLCRCTGYQNIVKAIQFAAAKLGGAPSREAAE